MKNAFIILGATPEDNIDKLKELFEEKQLFVDDDKELNNAFTDLTNTKKRIIHEIKYYSKDIFEDFDKIFNDNDDDQEMVMEDICSSIIKIGKWFDGSIEELYEKINENRKIAKFSLVGNTEIIQQTVLDLKEESISIIKKYFEYWEQKDIVSIFNMLVKQDDYMSFFIDDLLIHYENLESSVIENKVKNCNDKFALIEKNADSFIEDGILDDDFQSNITSFKRALNAWDKIVQPLQVNYQNRGAQHPASFSFVQELRNKVIDMCNKSQESLSGLIQRLSYDYSAKKEFITRAYDSETFTDLLIQLLDILSDTFKEIEITAERLEKDKTDFSNLKEQLSKILNQVDPWHSYSNTSNKKRQQKQTKQDYDEDDENYRTSWKSKSATSASDQTWKKAIRWIVGITIVLSLIGTIVSFASDGGSTAIGVISLIICIITCVCAYKWEQLDIKLDTMKVVSIVLAIAMGIVCVVSASISSSNSDGGYTPSGTSYTVTFNKQGGSGGSYSVEAYYDESMPYATKPSKSGYEFQGYYSSTNGNGTKYYDKNMNSVRRWDKKYSSTLYAYWQENDDGITLTTSNFENYFTLTSSYSVTQSSYQTTYSTAKYTYSISPKSSFHYSNSKNPSSITVTIGLDISSFSSSYGTPSEYKIYVTLYKSNGYKASGNQSYSISSSERYWNDGIYSVSGKIYN